MPRFQTRSIAGLLVVFSIAMGACAPTPKGPSRDTSAYRSQVLADGPAGYWRLDEESGAVAFDQTANANSGAIEKGVRPKYIGATTSDGNEAQSFDGLTGQITIPNSSSLQMKAGAVTLEAWVRPAGVQHGGFFIVAKGRAGVQTEYGLALVNGIPGYQSVSEFYSAKTAPLTPGVWTHVAVTVANNDVVTFYLNGEAAGRVSAGTNHVVTVATQPVTIANEAGPAQPFVGVIDEVAIYPRALTAEQLARHVALATQGPH